MEVVHYITYIVNTLNVKNSSLAANEQGLARCGYSRLVSPD
jgi:hypothetical protein